MSKKESRFSARDYTVGPLEVRVGVNKAEDHGIIITDNDGVELNFRKIGKGDGMTLAIDKYGKGGIASYFIKDVGKNNIGVLKYIRKFFTDLIEELEGPSE